MLPKKPNSEQFFYNVDGKWRAFDDEQSGLGDAYTFEEFQAETTVIDLESEAKTTRDTALEDSIEYDGVLWDIDTNARDNIAIALRKAERAELDDSESRMWRLADNTWRETTLAELKILLELYDSRFESIWTQYGIWDAGDKSEAFVISDE